MRTRIGFCIAIITLSSGALAQADELSWHTKYDVALQESRATGKPLLVAFRCVP